MEDRIGYRLVQITICFFYLTILGQKRFKLEKTDVFKTEVWGGGVDRGPSEIFFFELCFLDL